MLNLNANQLSKKHSKVTFEIDQRYLNVFKFSEYKKLYKKKFIHLNNRPMSLTFFQKLYNKYPILFLLIFNDYTKCLSFKYLSFITVK